MSIQNKDLKISYEETFVSDDLYVLDNLFTLSEKTHILEIVKGAFYKIGDNFNSKRYMRSEFDYREASATNIIRKVQKTIAAKLIHNNAFDHCSVYLDNYATTHNIRSVPGMNIVMFHANLEWNSNFGGDVTFYKEDSTTVEHTASYVPGRVIVVDGEKPHTFKPFTSEAPAQRFIVAMYYRKSLPTDDELIQESQ